VDGDSGAIASFVNNQGIIVGNLYLEVTIMSFSDVVEAVKTLSLEEKEEIQQLLAQYLREERREEIYQNYLASKEQENAGNLKFSSNIDELIQFLED
jgi:hypothetical protein